MADISKVKKPPKEVHSVVHGDVKVVKKSLGKKLMSLILSDDKDDIKSYLIRDIAIPKIKELIFDTVVGGSSMALWGDDRRTNRSSTSYYHYSGSNRRSNETYSYNKAQYNRRLSERDRSNFDFNSVIFETRSDVENIINGLIDIIEIYDQATVKDFYNLADISVDKWWTDDNYGWDERSPLSNARAVHTRDGWVIDLPRPIKLDI